jgi:hypothetical protein
LAFIVGLQFALEGVEAAGPEGAGFLQPGVDFLQAPGIEGLDARLALGPGGNEAGVAQDLQVLRDRRGAHVELVDNLPGGAVALREQFDDAAAGGVGEGFEAEHAPKIKYKLN